MNWLFLILGEAKGDRIRLTANLPVVKFTTEDNDCGLSDLVD
jgi:hypothetical protein